MEILHFLGLCPDTLAHYDLLDLFLSQYNNIILWITK